MTSAICEIADSSAVAAGPSPTARELWCRYHGGADEQTEEALVEKYLPLVSSAVARLAMTLPEHVDHDDLYSAGLAGLLQALRNYNPNCGAAFETYARLRIRGAMLDELRRMDWVPRTIHEKTRKIKTVMAELEQRLGQPPTETQMARELNLSVAEYGQLLNEVRPATFICLDATDASEDGDSGSLYELVPDESEESPVELASRNELKQVVFERLKELPEMQRKVLALYYLEDMHLREIAEAFGLTESRICQIHAQAILALRSHVQRLESGLAKRPATSSPA